MTFKHLSAFALLAATAACSDPTAAPATTALDAVAARAPGGGSTPRYKLRFITGVNMTGPNMQQQNDGEIQSGWFPDTGVVLNTKAPWKSLTVRGATIDLVNSTHGDWTAGTCATFRSSAAINPTTWDVRDVTGNLLGSFQGRWFGTLSIYEMSGMSVAFDGDRVVDGVVTGGIHNVVTNANQSYQTKGPNNESFRLELRNAALKFGSASTTDGVSNPVGAEVACANFTIEAMLVTLIDP